MPIEPSNDVSQFFGILYTTYTENEIEKHHTWPRITHLFFMLPFSGVTKIAIQLASSKAIRIYSCIFFMLFIIDVSYLIGDALYLKDIFEVPK